MISLKQIFLLLSCVVLIVLARPDDGETVTVPGPGLSYGGIPYGSMSGNVAQYFKQRAASGSRAGHFAHQVDFAPIEQWLR